MLVQPTLPFNEFAVPRGAIRRRVFRIHPDPLPTGTYIFKAKSFSRRGGPSYRCYVNPVTGYVFCSCRDFQFRKGRFLPSYPKGPACKHLERAIRTVRKIEKARTHESSIAA